MCEQKCEQKKKAQSIFHIEDGKKDDNQQEN